LYFLQHFFFIFASAMGKGKGSLKALGLVSVLFFPACMMPAYWFAPAVEAPLVFI